MGYHVFSRLLKRKSPAFFPIGIVSNDRAGKALLQLGARPEQVQVADIRRKDSLAGYASVYCDDDDNIHYMFMHTLWKNKKSKFSYFFYMFCNFVKPKPILSFDRTMYSWSSYMLAIFTYSRIFDKAEKVIICSSARPRKHWGRRVKDFLKRWVLRKQSIPIRPHDMYYEKGEDPYSIDYIGARNIIDASTESGKV